MHETRIVLMDKAGGEKEAIVQQELFSRHLPSIGRTERVCRITLRWDSGTVIGTGGDYFSALCRVREQLEVDGYRPHCYGASRNVILRSIDQDLGVGSKVHKAEIGHPLRKEDHVGILESGPDVEPVTVEEQRAFQEEWHKNGGLDARQSR